MGSKQTDYLYNFLRKLEIYSNCLSNDNRLASAILETIGAVVCVMDMNGRIVLFNKAAQNLTDYAEEEVINKYPWDLFIIPEESDGVRNVFSELTLGHFPNQYINYWLTKSGDKRLISWSNTALANENGKLAYIIATGIDITEQRLAENKIAQNQKDLEKLVSVRTADLNEANHKLEMLAYQDAVTGLHNRRYLNNVVEREIRRTRRINQPLSLLIADVDFFKNYNDTYGHVAGDMCLRNIADLFKRHFQRASDLIARYGGEEFCVVLPNMHHEAAKELSRNFLKLVWNSDFPHAASPIADRVTISIGLATCPCDHNCDKETLIKIADSALYVAKKSGRNRLEATELEPIASV